MDSIAELIENRRFYHVFQPICHLPQKRTVGYEALIRSTSPVGPDELFQRAMEQQKLFHLDTLSILRAIQAFFAERLQEKKELLFVNIYPSTIIDEHFPGFIDGLVSRYRPYVKRIVLEINESIIEQKIWMNPLFIRRIALLRKRGFMIALDDVGDGTTSLRKIVEISPDYIKMDKFFADGLAESVKKQKIVRLLVQYCKGEAHLILEGIEHEEDYSRAAALGVSIAQGYYLGRPGRLKSDTCNRQILEE